MNEAKHTQEADEVVRYCPECGLIGPVKRPALSCCPDSFGMSVRRWQAEKLERMLDRTRAFQAAASLYAKDAERLREALKVAQRAINSMKVEAETAAVGGDEEMWRDAAVTISNEGLDADIAIRAALEGETK